MLHNPLQQFFRTTAQPCPYIKGQHERKVLTELGGADSISLYNKLSRAGFRRSRNFAYRPACPNCISCVPVRIVVNDFLITRSLRRVWQNASDLTVAELPARANLEQYRLFSRYLAHRHANSDMTEMTYGEYNAMVEETAIETRLITLRDACANLVGVCLIDLLDDGLSAVYSFYDPDQPKRGFGKLLIMHLVEWARAHGLPYVYLGYWIADSRKMAYKTRFRPLEELGPLGWKLMSFEDNS